ncbi:MAG: hypothetical protein BAA04_06210 [Firmicutes bacterium ZCTH02-B6]|nr:MAG: hypothetical protein BAA04_06210 [Firmicutes bacterium ZCTH02-B6]
MSFKFEPRTVRMERPIGTATQQAVTAGSFELPAGLPDISRIVRVAIHPVVTGWEALDNQVAVQGTVDLVLLYAHEEQVAPEPVAASGHIEAEAGYVEDDILADEPRAEVREVLYRYRWRRAGTFEAVLEIPGTHPEVTVEAQSAPEAVEVELHASGRRVDVEAVVTVSARVAEYVAATVPVKSRPFPPEAGAVETAVRVENVAGRGEAHLSVDGVLAVEGVPCRRVLDVAAVARPTKAIAAGGEVTVAGVVDYRVLYVDDRGQLHTASWSEQTPFAHSFPLPAAAEGAPVDVAARVSSIDGAPGEGGREIRVWTDVEVTVRLAKVEELPLVEHFGGSEKLDVRCRTEDLTLEEWVGSAALETTVTGTLELPEGHPPIERILVAGARARVDDVMPVAGRVIVEGRVEVEALYVARSPGQPVHAVSWTDGLPFELELAVPGTEPGFEAAARVQVEDVALDLINRETVEAEVRLVARVRVARPAARMAVVEAVAVPPPDPDPPTWTFVVLQDGDTLWALSHRYHTDVDRIVAANPWLEGEDGPLPAGRKLCIPRRGPSTPLGA